MISRNTKESDKAIKLCNGTCVVCGYNVKNSKGKSLVVGAHVRPFESGKEFDYYNNIIALCPNCHAEYDAHLFYIDTKNKTLHFLHKNDKELKYIGDKIKYVDEKYLAYNEYLYKKKNGIDEF